MVLRGLFNIGSRYLWIIIGIMLMGLPMSEVLGQDRKRLEDEKAKIEKEIATINSILNQTKKSKNLSASELAILRKKIRERERLIKNISEQTKALDEEIESAKTSIHKLSDEIGFLKKEYAQMLRLAQRNQTSTNRFLFIFSAKDHRQAYQRYVFFKQYGTMQKEKMLEIKAKTSELEKVSDELALKRTNQENLLNQEERHKKTLTNEQRTKQNTVNSLQKKERQLAAQIKEKQARRRKLQNQIDAAIAAEIKKQQELANKAKGKDAKDSEYIMSSTPEEIQLSKDFASNKGKLPWPTEKGIISGRYGTHPHPDIKGVVTENLGIDIRTNKGSSIRAVFDGEVARVFKGPYGQNVVIIRHGEYMTVYINLSSVSVNPGNKVKTKQSIGIAYTNSDNVTEINFQVWKGQDRQNPAAWIAN